MSRAFVKEADGSEAVAALPDRPLGPHRNLVTAEGLAQIEAEAARSRAAVAAAQAEDNREALARAARDLRYWTARRATAELVPPPDDDGAVHFGLLVTVERDDGRRQTFRIVGQDQADPSRGLLSYVSPLATALIGRRVGDVVPAGAGEAEIVAIARGADAGG